MLILLPQALPYQAIHRFQSISFSPRTKTDRKNKNENKVAQAALGRFSKLPERIFGFASSFLSFNEQIALAKTCSHANKLVTNGKVYVIYDINMSRKLYFPSKQLVPPHSQWITKRSHIVWLDTEMSQDIILDRCNHFPNATHLVVKIIIRENNLPYTVSPINRIFDWILKANALKNLAEIELEYQNENNKREVFGDNAMVLFDATCLIQFPNLRIFNDFQRLSPKNIEKIKFSLLPKLEKITLWNGDFNILEYCKNMKSLSVTHSSLITDDVIKNLCEKNVLQNLESLSLCRCYNLTSSCIMYIASCHKLKKLTLQELDFASFNLLRSLFHHLEFLSIGVLSLSQNEFDSWQKPKELKHFEVNIVSVKNDNKKTLFVVEGRNFLKKVECAHYTEGVSKVGF